MMVRTVLTGAGVALGVLALAATAHAQRSAELAGKWKAQAASAAGSMQTCNIELREDEWFGGYRASSFGCSGRLFGVSKWQTRGSSLVLLGGGDRELATLSMRGGRLVGEDSDGKPVTLTRAGAPPRLAGPPPGWDRDDRRGPREGSDCVRYGESSRCATEREMERPSIRALAGQDLHARTQGRSPVLARVPAGACLPVQACGMEGDNLWCQVRYRGQSGHLRQTGREGGVERLMFETGCD